MVKHALSVTQTSGNCSFLGLHYVALELVQWEYVGIICKIIHINTRCQPDPQAIGLGMSCAFLASEITVKSGEILVNHQFWMIFYRDFTVKHGDLTNENDGINGNIM